MSRKICMFICTCLLYISGFAQNKGVECTIKALKTVIKQGELPEIEAIIHNKTDTTIYLIEPLAGSFDKARYPYAYFTVELVDDSTYHLTEPYRCGHLDEITLKHFIKVLPDSLFSELYYPSIDFSDFKIKGIYKIQYHYSTQASYLSAYMSPENSLGYFFADSKNSKRHLTKSERKKYKIFSKLFKKVPRLNLSSNFVFITVE